MNRKKKAMQVLDGLMLGDGSLTRRNNAYYSMAMSKLAISLDDHLKYEQWIVDNVFAVLSIPASTKATNGVCRGKPYQKAILWTYQLPLLTELHDKWYVGGEWTQKGGGRYVHGATKVLPDYLMQAEELPTLALAHWFLGDGSSSWGYLKLGSPRLTVNLAACGFTKGEVYHLMAMLNNMGITTTKPGRQQTIRGQGLSIVLAQDSVNRFMDLIEPHILEIFSDSESPSYKDMIKRRLKPARLYKPRQKSIFSDLRIKLSQGKN